MSNLELLSAGFSAILGTEVVPQKGGGGSLHDLFSQICIMKPVETVKKVEAGEKFDIFFKMANHKQNNNYPSVKCVLKCGVDHTWRRTSASLNYERFRRHQVKLK